MITDSLDKLRNYAALNSRIAAAERLIRVMA